MNTSTSACYDFAANRPKRSSRKAVPQNLFGSVAVASLVLGCAWTMYANVFGSSVYPALSSANFESPVIRRSPAFAARSPATIIDNVFAALAEPAPLVSAPAQIASGSSLLFEDRFAAAAPQGQASQATRAPTKIEAPQVAQTPPAVQTPKLAEVAKPAAAPKLAEATKLQQAPKPQVVASLPAARPAEAPAKTAGASVRDMAQRAKAAVMSIASNERLSITEKLWGKHESRGSLLSFASADASFTGSLPSVTGQVQNPMLGGSPPYDRQTAVYDITAHVVYLPDGSKLEAHSGLGSKLDDPHSSNIRMHGVTPPHIYELTPREALFHGVPALRLTPVGGEDAIFGRSGLLAHTYMLGPNGDSNGCVSFRDYNAFLNAYRNQGIKRLAVVAQVE